jgi:hypothetical protein
LNQLVSFGFFQSLFLLLIYFLSAKNRKNINGYIAFLVLVLAIGLAGRVLYISEVFGKDFRLIAFSEFSVLLFGSTLYLFARSSLLNKPFSYKDLMHYIPALVYSLLIIFIIMLPSDVVIASRAKSGELLNTIFIFMGTGLR